MFNMNFDIKLHKGPSNQGLGSQLEFYPNGNFKIGEQDCDELKIIMRAIFLEHSKNLPTRIDDQIKVLNDKVLYFAVDQVYQSAVSYLKYIRDASTLADPIPHSVNTSPQTNTLELGRFV